nr:G protein-coupled receptor [Proales similis]
MVPNQTEALELSGSGLIEQYSRIASFVWILVVIFGLISNGLAIYSILSVDRLRNVTTCFILNLAVADSAFLFLCVPFTSMTFVYEQWLFGAFLCKWYNYASLVTVCAVCLTLMTMTIDRYIYICKLNEPVWRKPVLVLKLSALIWIVAHLVALPNWFGYKLVAQVYQSRMNETHLESFRVLECIQDDTFISREQSQWYTIIVSFIIPTGVLLFCYQRIVAFLGSRARKFNQPTYLRVQSGLARKRKVTKSVIKITFLFIACWMPVHLFAIWYRVDANFPRNSFTFLLKLTTHTLSFVCSAINPLVYAFSIKPLRQQLLKLIPCYSSNNQAPVCPSYQLTANLV